MLGRRLALGQLETGPVSGVECLVRCERGPRDQRLYRFREEMGREKLLKLLNECSENALKEAFYKGTEAPSADNDKWILLESCGDKQIGDSMELGDADLQRQGHGLVIRGDEAARAIRVDGMDHDAVV